MKKAILSIDGMTCSACSNGLEKYLNKQEGILSATVNLVMATASIEYDDKLSIKDLEKFIAEAGFKSLGKVKLDEENNKDKKYIHLIYGTLALLIMYISMSSHLNLYIPNILNMTTNPKIFSITLLIMTIPFLIYGYDIIKNGVNNLIHKMPNMDTLVGIGVISSFLYSLFGVIMILSNNLEYLHRLYFESTAFVIFFIKLGRFVDKNSKNKTKEAIKKLVTITPKVAKKYVNEKIKEITIDEVKKGDILVCLAGDRVAVDGEIVKGEAHFDESFITGESKPVSKHKGDKVIAGSINYDSLIEYKAEKIGKESTISEIVNLVVEATNTKAPIALLADKISSYFVPLILIISLLTLIIGAFTIQFNEALIRFVTVLVVACPCALGLATPLAIVVAEGTSAKKGILVKKSETLELCSKIDTVVMDKTGTLTNGILTVSKIYNYSKLKDDALLSILGSIENNSIHPIAKGIIKYINDNKIEIDKEFKCTELSGKGIKAVKDKDTYYVGNNKIISDLNIKNDYKKDESVLTKEGNSIVYIIKNKEIIGLVGVKDTIRIEAKSFIKKLKKMNINLIMLTGDNQDTAEIIAKELDIKNVISNVSPKEKVEVIKKLKNEGKRVIMVGDGINDAPSLTLADIGISVSSGTDIATDSSDVILMNSNLEKIVELFKISRKTLKIIKQNLFWAFIYNILMIPIAIGLIKVIKINPMIACIAMICSSFIVTINSLRLRKI